MRIVLTGGGTGGHVFPLIAVARELMRRVPDADVRFVGPLPFGAEFLVREGIVVRGIHAGKFPRYATPKLFLELLKIPVGFVQALWELYWFMPHVVFGKGGYGMVPVAFVAWLFRIPVVIHESDAVAGVSSRLVARFARAILVSFPETRGLPSGRLKVVGNPVRKTLTGGDRARAQQRFHLALSSVVLVLGGSQGAEEINSVMLELAPQLLGEAEIIHQVGEHNEERFAREMALVLEPYPDKVRFYHIVPFFDETALADAYAAATVAISRAGAGAMFELALVGLPTIFIPKMQGSAGNHQYWNANFLAGRGAAVILAGENLTPHPLLSEIRTLLNDAGKRAEMSQRLRAIAQPDAAPKIAETILSFVK